MHSMLDSQKLFFLRVVYTEKRDVIIATQATQSEI